MVVERAGVFSIRGIVSKIPEDSFPIDVRFAEVQFLKWTVFTDVVDSMQWIQTVAPEFNQSSVEPGERFPLSTRTPPPQSLESLYRL